jgi:hypothetical protein
LTDANNEKRCIASQIIVDLYGAREKRQLEVLQVQINVALELIGATE